MAVNACVAAWNHWNKNISRFSLVLNIPGKVETVNRFSWASKSLWIVTAAMKWKTLVWKESYDKPRQCIKKQRYHFADRSLSGQSYGFSSSHVWMWELDHKESWAPKNWCFWVVVLEKTLESPLDCKESKQSILKENHSWIFIGGTDIEAEASIILPPDVKSQLIEKTLMLGRLKAKGERGKQRVRWLNSFTNSVDMNLSKLQEIVKNREAWLILVHGVTKSWTGLGDWITTVLQGHKMTMFPFFFPNSACLTLCASTQTDL